MAETSSSSQISSLVSVSALSGSSLLAGTHTQQQQHALSTKELSLERELAASLSYDILASQKRSSDVAFGESQVAFEREVKHVKLELQSAERERDAATAQCRRLNLQLRECQEELSRVRQTLSETKLDARARVDSLLNVSRENEALEELAELQHLFDEQAASISQLALVEERKSELESENASLRTRLEQALHGPGNSSSLISRPDGSGLMRSSSLLHSTRLEQRVAALESENAELRRKQADLLVAKTEAETLKEKLARANEWRERALLAEEVTQAAGRDVSALSSAVNEPTAVSQVQRENALLLAEQGQLRGQIKANEVEIADVKSRILVLTTETERLEASLKCLDQINRRQSKRITILQQVQNYQDADATLASPSADLVFQFKTAVSGLQSSLDAFAAESSAETTELQRLLSELARRGERTVAAGLQFDEAEIYARGDNCVGCELLQSRLPRHLCTPRDSQRAGSKRSDLRRICYTLSSPTWALCYYQVKKQERAQVAGASGAAHRRAATPGSDLLDRNIAELEEANAQLKESRERVELENECMRARGAFNPDETRVLHLVSNPADNAVNNLKEELVTLRKENGTLKQRVSVRI
ncbi:unnamed protein product [Schistocephalus solidus]|uniref:Protein CASP n=1 Tax=Schistocephalus solidus TaxID=70667 RepID=A0A183TDU8_SCHSO|nr:unnamed protein product [Schistocephalus solidus]